MSEATEPRASGATDERAGITQAELQGLIRGVLAATVGRAVDGVRPADTLASLGLETEDLDTVLMELDTIFLDELPDLPATAATVADLVGHVWDALRQHHA